MITAAEIKPYDILECDGVRYRILGIEDKIVTIQMDTSTRIFRMFETGSHFDAEVLSGRCKITRNETPYVIPVMSSVCQAAYDLNKEIINEIAGIYGPDCYKGLSSHNLKSPLVELRNRYQISKSKLNRIITSWLQSGCSDYALLDHRAKGLRHANGPYHYEKRPGRKNQNEEDTSTVVLNDELRELFDKVIRQRMNSKLGHYSTFFRDAVNEHYSAHLRLDDNYSIIKEEARNIPTLRQFYHYLSKHGGVTDKDLYIAVNSETEYRNNCRPLNSDINYGVCGIGDRMETDILDMDVILRAKGFNIAAGRPHLYMLADIAARTVPAFYVSFTNNSITGLQGLLHNIGEDKVALCRKYGIEIKAEEWPSGFIPGSIYVDNGADFASDKIMEIFQRLGVERDLEPPAMGSMKGTIEHLFDQFYDTHKDLLEKHGVILKRYDSNHYEEATLDMDDIIKIVILFILYLHKHYMPNYPVTKEMLDENIECTPLSLHQYMCERYPVRWITDAKQYQLDCMFETKASVRRGDIIFQKHHYSYDPADTLFSCDFCETMKISRLTVRYTRISADFIMYQHNGRWYKAQLNTRRSDEASFAGLTRDELEEYDNQKLSNDAVGERKNIKVMGDCRQEMKKTIKEAEKKASMASSVSKDKKDEIIRNEKQNVLGNVLPSLNSVKKETTPKTEQVRITQIPDMDWNDAMEDLYI